MIREAFEKISQQLNSDYQYMDKIVKGIGLSSMPISYHTLKASYKNTTIIVKYEFGNFNLATINTSITSINHRYIFELKKNSHFKLFFTRNKKSLKVITGSQKAKDDIEQLLSDSGLEKIASSSLFEPTIQFQQDKGSTNIVTTYYLGFQGKEKSIMPIVNFYKGLIDLVQFD